VHNAGLFPNGSTTTPGTWVDGSLLLVLTAVLLEPRSSANPSSLDPCCSRPLRFYASRRSTATMSASAEKTNSIDERASSSEEGIHAKHFDSVYDENTIDSSYLAKARVLNDAIQDIGMGKYQWCVAFALSLGRKLTPLASGGSSSLQVSAGSRKFILSCCVKC
jgi:hypothetical protein